MFLSERNDINDQISALQIKRGIYATCDRELCSSGLEGEGCDEMHYQNAHFCYEFSKTYIKNVIQTYDMNGIGPCYVDGELVEKKILYKL